MSEFDETLHSVLSNPEAMDQIMALAQSLSGGTGKEREPLEEADEPQTICEGKTLADQVMGSNDPGTELLHALGPYLKEERRKRLDRALELARTTRLIRTAVSAMSGTGEGSHV